MSSKFESIDPQHLITVSGGAGGEQISGNLGVSVPTEAGPVQLGAQGSRSQSDYAKCVGTVSGMQGATPADIRATCGLPPASGN